MSEEPVKTKIQSKDLKEYVSKMKKNLKVKIKNL
jgi:hypothetical protein